MSNSQLPYLTAGTSYRFTWNGKELQYISKKEEDDPTVKELEEAIKAASNGDTKALDVDILYPQEYVSAELISSTIKRGHRVATELYKEGRALEAATRLSLVFDLTAHFAYLATGNNNVQEESFVRPEGWLIAWQALQVDAKNYLTPLNDYGFFLQEAAEHEQAVALFRIVIKESPKRDVAYLNLADSLWALNEQTEAQRYYQIYTKLMLAAGKQDKIPARVKERITNE
jgi:tetratricopeptide (TPR) repeat protein